MSAPLAHRALIVKVVSQQWLDLVTIMAQLEVFKKQILIINIHKLTALGGKKENALFGYV